MLANLQVIIEAHDCCMRRLIPLLVLVPVPTAVASSFWSSEESGSQLPPHMKVIAMVIIVILILLPLTSYLDVYAEIVLLHYPCILSVNFVRSS